MHSPSVSGTKKTWQLCSIKSPISEEPFSALSSELSGSSELLYCSSEPLVTILLFVEHPERN